jgi:hypothetical protein
MSLSICLSLVKELIIKRAQSPVPNKKKKVVTINVKPLALSYSMHGQGSNDMGIHGGWGSKVISSPKLKF